MWVVRFDPSAKARLFGARVRGKVDRMKLSPFAALVCLGVVSVAACREEEPFDTDPIQPDGGTSSEGGTSKTDSGTQPTDGGTRPDASDGGTTPAGRQLTAGEIEILSTLADGTIVFRRYAAKVSLEAIAPTGGAPTVIAPDLVLEGEDTDDVVVVIGGAVGLWTGVNADTGIGKLSIWTKANGLKEAAAQSPIYEVDASNDGARVAFVRQMGADLQLVTAPSTLAGQPTVVQDALGDGSQANPCPAFYTFVAQNLFTSTCTGAGITATARRTDPAGAQVQIDTGLAPYFLSVSANGDKVFSAKRITAGGTGGAAAVYNVGATVTEVAIEAAGVAEGSISRDGTTVVYRTRLGALKKAATAAPVNATELAANGSLMGILATSPDSKAVLSHKLAPGGDFGGLYDLQLSGTATPAAPTTLVATATAIEFGFSLGSKYAFWVPNPAMPQVKARAAAGGGADIDLGAAQVFLGKIDGSDKIVLGENEREITVDGRKVSVVDFKLRDPAAPASSVVLAQGAEVGGLVMPGGKQLLYTEAAKGLFIRDIP